MAAFRLKNPFMPKEVAPAPEGPTVPGPTVPGPAVPGPAVPGPAVPGPAVPRPAAPPTDSDPSSNPFSLKRYPSGVRKIASFGLTLYIIGLLVTARWAPDYWVVSVLCSSACMALGWAIGFLFGVPRVASTTASARINTNLEQISDWLTKILVGVGLTQLRQLPAVLRGLAAYISKDYGKSGNDVFSLSMVLFFSTLGFLTGYLITRLALQQAFDEEAAEKNTQINTTGPANITVTQPPADKPPADNPAADNPPTDNPPA